MMELTDLRHIYFMGIGGIGMSAIARYFSGKGIRVSGYDRTPTELTSRLQEEGMHIDFDENPALLPSDIDLVVLTPAIPSTHTGLQELRRRNLPVMKRSEILGVISNDKQSVCIAGTHGKTTTSTMTAHLLRHSGMDISAFLGGISVDLGSNYVLGESDVVVLEADEYDRSFLQLTPYIASISSLDADHLDIYGSREGMLEGYSQFAARIRHDGYLVIRQGLLEQLNQDVVVAMKQRNVRILTYGGKDADILIENIHIDNQQFVFTYTGLGQRIDQIRVNLPGRHNVENATVALTSGLLLGADIYLMKEALSNFRGIQRRFERIFTSEKVVFIDDYAHHPGELSVAIAAARELYPGRHITGIFQPHLFTRTRDFASGFASELDKLDAVLLMDIYPARELPIEGITSSVIFNQMKLVDRQEVTKATLMDVLANRKTDVIMTLGAGDIDTFVPKINQMLKNKFK